MNARIVKSFAAVTFQPKQDSASTSPFALASANFNGDGRLGNGAATG